MATNDDRTMTSPEGLGADTQFGRLGDLDDFKVADGYPDIRGWEVKTADGRTVGKVDELIVDTSQMRVRYLDIEVDRTVGELARDATTAGDQERHTLLPIGTVRLDDEHDDVLLDGYTAEQVAALPRYSGRGISADYERSLRERSRDRLTGGSALGAATALGGAAALDVGRYDAYDHGDYDDQRPFATRRGARGTQGAEGTQRLTLAEERLEVGTRQVQQGQVEVRKTVETEHVRQQVPVTHEEVTVERRPITDASTAARAPQIGEDEIRVQIMEEQLVVEKKLVPREEIIVRKRMVTEQQTVEADVRRERLDVDETSTRTSAGASTRAAGLTGGAASASGTTSGAADRATNSGPLDRLADKLDDVKDRVDGNPASKPGPDRTDRKI